jgi:hypothetical protein
MQYVENGLLVYDPQNKEQPFSFSDLGEQLNIYEPPVITTEPQEDLVINGYRIHPVFVDLYLQLGSHVVGAPLTNPQENVAQNRIEQHFQNLGFYYRLDDLDKKVRLLAYGRAVCGGLCPYKGNIDSAFITTSSLSEPFESLRKRLGVSVTGPLVAGPFTATDGFEEVIFEHMVLYSNNGYVAARPLVLSLGYLPQPLVEPLDLPVVVFIVVEGNLGHNVLVAFNDYIIQNGGYELSGMPVSEVFEFNHELGVIRQCFTNLCLDYFPNEQEAQVRPANLGTEYKNSFYPNMDIVSVDGKSPDEAPSLSPRNSAQNIFQLNIWESSPLVLSSEPQTLYASVFFNDTPQAGQQLTLTIYVPDAPPQTVFMPATNTDGQTAIALAPVATSNGTLIIYEICMDLAEGISQCEQESFLIWGH